MGCRDQAGDITIYNMSLLKFPVCLLLALFGCFYAAAQNSPSATASIDPSLLPGKGLSQHDFLYTGEWDYRRATQTIYLVHKGRITWSYAVPFRDSSGTMEELGDATMRANGNIVFCRKTGASEVTPDKKIIWNYDAPKGTEIHSVEPIGPEKVLMVINGVPARVMLINVMTGKTENEFIIPTGAPAPHLQFRRVRMTPSGTILAAHMDSTIVVEYDLQGRPVWSVRANHPWSVSRLSSGNTLITTNRASYIWEVDKKGDTVWDIRQSDIPGIKLYQLQVAVRLDNGNTIFSNWCNNAIKDTAAWPGSVQLIEVTPARKVVWALSQWNNPDMGPASSIQILDGVDLDRIKEFRVKD
jgi:hypothetical protein